jgi:large subunit ribosomal protein L4
MHTSVYNLAGEIVGQTELSESIFGLSFNGAVVHQAMVMQLANRRQGTASTKSRGEVSGSRRKLYAQKHTGRARRGDVKSPLLRGGGVAFGPKPRTYRQSMPKKMRRLAIKCVLSSKVNEGNFKVLEELSFERPKTKDFSSILKALNIVNNALIVTEKSDVNVVRSALNLSNIKVLPSAQINVLELLSCETLITTVAALKNIENIWKTRDN